MRAFNKTIVYALVIGMLVQSCKEEKKTDTAAEEEVLEKTASTPQEQLTEIMNFWPGTYNNDQQIAEAKKVGQDVWLLDDTGQDGWLQIESHYLKIDNSAIGEHVLYVEEYRDHQPDSTYRQRIYTLAIDSTNTIRVKMWPFKDKKKYIGAWKNPSLLDSLKVEEISASPSF